MKILQDYRQKLSIWGIITSIILSGGLTLVLSASGELERAFSVSIYYFLIISSLLLLTGMYDSFRKIKPGRIRNFLSALGVASALMALVFMTVGAQFRVLSDETNLLSASLSLYRNNSFYNITEAVHAFDRFHIISQAVPHRPGFFPFLTAILHSLTGFRPSNAFVVNFLAAVGTLVIVFELGRELLNEVYGAVAALLLACFPLFNLTATSAGFDALNLFFLSLTFHQMIRFLKRPSCLLAEQLLFIIILAAQCRYETVLLLLPGLGVIMLERKNLRMQDFSLRIFAIPLLLLPVFWQRILSVNISNPGEMQANPLSPAFLPSNILHSMEFFFNPGQKDFPTAEIIVILAVMGVLAYIIRSLMLKRKLKWEPRTKLLTLLLGGIALIGLIHHSYYYGDIREPWVMRLGTIYLLPLCLAAAYPFHFLVQRKRGVILTVALLCILFIHYLPVAQKNLHGKTLTLSREYMQNLKIIDKHAGNLLVISGRQSMYTARNHSAVGFKFANQNSGKLRKQLQEGIFTGILVIQKVSRATDRPLLELSPNYQLQSIKEYPVSDKYFNRISLVRPGLSLSAASAKGQNSKPQNH